MMVYVVMHHEGIVGISARLQGAELMRALFREQYGDTYGCVRIEDHYVEDGD